MELTYQQYIAIMRILMDIINADGRIDAREMFLYDKLKDEFKLTYDDLEIVKRKNSLLALAQVKEMTKEEKSYFASLMRRMIIVDEDINVNEVAIHDLVCELCGINVDFYDSIPPESTDIGSKS